MSRDQGYSPLDFDHHSLGGEDEDFHDEHYQPKVEVSAGPIKIIRKQPGRVIMVPAGGRPPPLVRGVSLMLQGYYAGAVGNFIVNFGSFMSAFYLPAANGASANGVFPVISVSDFDFEVNEFTVQNAPGVTPSGAVWGLFITGPGE